jgi:hypothetical protein
MIDRAFVSVVGKVKRILILSLITSLYLILDPDVLPRPRKVKAAQEIRAVDRCVRAGQNYFHFPFKKTHMRAMGYIQARKQPEREGPTGEHHGGSSLKLCKPEATQLSGRIAHQITHGPGRRSHTFALRCLASYSLFIAT